MRMTNPELKVVRFASEDVIATSLFAYEDGANYIVYNGTINSAPENNGTWRIDITGEYQTMTSSEYDAFKDSISRDRLYDAFDGGDGYYYTYGVEIQASIGGGAGNATGGPTNPPLFPIGQ